MARERTQNAVCQRREHRTQHAKGDSPEYAMGENTEHSMPRERSQNTVCQGREPRTEYAKGENTEQSMPREREREHRTQYAK